MAAKKFMRNINGIITEVFGIQTSGGAGNAGDIPALDETGRLDQTMMPVGIGADTAIVPASENLAAGDFVNVHTDGGVAKARKADASVAGKEAIGFVLATVSSGNNATVYFEGTNTQVTGQTPGTVVFLQTTAGKAGDAVPSGTGNVAQRIGIAISATEVNFEPAQPIVLA